MIQCLDTGESFDSYDDYLRSDHWKMFKSAFKGESPYKCVSCESEESLDVHHLTYENIGNESFDDVAYLCRTCHKVVHRVMTRNHRYKIDAFITKRKEIVKEGITRTRKEKEFYFKSATLGLVRYMPDELLDANISFFEKHRKQRNLYKMATRKSRQ